MIIVVDSSAIDSATATAIKRALEDLVNQLPEYDSLTLITTGDSAAIHVDGVELKGTKRDAAINAIAGIAFGGSRHLLPGVEGAVAEAVKVGPGTYNVLLIATGADGTTLQQLHDAEWAPALATGSSNVGINLHTIAIGAGEHEALLSRAGANDKYQWARSGSDLPIALVPYRLAVSEATLLAVGPIPREAVATAVVGRSHLGVRFTVNSVGRSRGLEVESPGGQVYGVGSHGEGVTVQEIGERVSIVINGADPGEWRLRFTGPGDTAVRAWFEVEETATLMNPSLTAYGTGDTTEQLKMGVGLPVPEDNVKTASARVVDPDGSERSIPFAKMKQDDLNIGGFILVLGTIVDRPEPAGSYRVYIDVDMVDLAGDRRVYHWILGAYVAPLRDSDGDGIRDSLEEHNGLDPHDPTDGAADHDFDGLSTSKELIDTGTSPIKWDTDGGGESDGSEVAAGRNPLDMKDDKPAQTCVNLIPRPSPGAVPTPTPRTSPEPAPELEALLPDEVLGRQTQKVSMRAPRSLESVLGLFDAVLACTHKERQDLSLAIAVAKDLNAWSVVGVRIDGVTGPEMADIWLFRMTNGPTGGPLIKKTIDGRQYWLSNVGWAVYSTRDTFYWITSLAYGDFPPASPPPMPSSQEIVEAFIGQLPLDR